MADEWSQYAVNNNPSDEWSQYAVVSKPNLTGNPSIDMKDVNSELSKAQAEANKGTYDLGRIASVTGLDRLARNAGNIISGTNNLVQNTFYHPIDTLKSAVDTASRPKEFIANYLDRYSPSRIKDTLYNDPLGVVMDASLVGGMGKLALKTDIARTAVSKAENIITKELTPEQRVSKSENIVQRLLNPSKDEIASAILKNSTVPAVRETAKVIKKSRNYKELLSNIDNAIKTNFSERQAIYEYNNYKMTDNYIKNAEEKLAQRKLDSQVSPAEIRQRELAIANEKAWYVKNKDNFDRLSGQAKKEYLQKQTEPLLKAERMGQNTDIGRYRMQALDELRSGLMKELEGNDPRVRDLNSTYAGLLEARDMIANQAAIIEQNVNKGMVERLLTLAQSVINPKAAAVNIALNNSRNISRLSGKAEKLMAMATKNKVKTVVEEAIKNEKVLGLPDLTPRYLKERVDMKGDLGTKTGPMKNRPYQVGGIEDKGTINL